jgi:hypothetical protein
VRVRGDERGECGDGDGDGECRLEGASEVSEVVVVAVASGGL